jgi:hypothetical protein
VVGPIGRINDDTKLAVINIEDVTLNAGSRQGGSAIEAAVTASPSRRYPVAGWNEGDFYRLCVN